MHLIVRLPLVYFLMITGLTCCHPRQMSTQTVTNRQLIFGSGGGFSGQVIEYTLAESGRLSRTNSLTKEQSQVIVLASKDAHSYFEQAAQLHLDTLNFKHPGNMYYFIRLKDGDTQQEVVWGDNNHRVPAKVEALYQALEKAVTE